MPNSAETRTIEFGPFRINTTDKLLHRNGRVLKVYPRSVDVLLALLGSNGRVVTGEELLEAVWGQTNVERGNVTSSISDLRKALGDSLKTHTYIETIPTRGYRWIGPITRVDKPASKSLAVVVLPLESLTTDPAEKYFAAGMTEALLAGLGKIEALKVIAYSGANGGQREPADLAHSVAAGFALTGSVLHKQEMLRITVHL